MMDDSYAAICFSFLIIIFLLPVFFLRKRHRDFSSQAAHDGEDHVFLAPNVDRTTQFRRTRRRHAASASTSSASTTIAEDSSDDNVREDSHVHVNSRQSRRRERRQQEPENQVVVTANELKPITRREQYEKERQRRYEEMEAQEKKLEEEARIRKDRKKEAGIIDYEKWKYEFSGDGEGNEGNQMEQDQHLMTEFLEKIKASRSVLLEDLAAEFGMRTRQCINMIKKLESRGELSGLMDDRGGYINISRDEMKGLADYIKVEGRVTISHLSSKSNQFFPQIPPLLI